MTAPIAVLDSQDQARALLSPERLRIVRALAEADSASGLARRLGESRQRLNYHLRELEAQGLLELVREERRGGFTERVLRATARAYVVSPDALGALGADPAMVRDRLSASYLIALAARAIRELSGLTARAGREGKRLATLSLEADVRFASAERRAAFAAELSAAMASLVARYHDADAPGGRTFRVTVAGWPAPSTTPGSKIEASSPGADAEERAR